MICDLGNLVFLFHQESFSDISPESITLFSYFCKHVHQINVDLYKVFVISALHGLQLLNLFSDNNWPRNVEGCDLYWMLN